MERRRTINPDPWVVKVYVELSPPRLGDNLADVERLLRGVGERFPGKRIHAPHRLSNSVSRTLRDAQFKVTAILSDLGRGLELTDIEPGDTTDVLLGLAVDLGTTSIVFYLTDLRSGEVLAEASAANPQIEHGADVLSRIHFAGQQGGLERLQGMVAECFNVHAERMCGENGASPRSIYAVSVAGNTTMTHLFLGLDPFHIRREPYIPVRNRPGFIAARELGIAVNPGACVYVFPNVGSYFGGDLVAGILYSGMHKETDVSILVDVGTNAEVVLGNRDWLLACAGAAGPALEGGVAQMGTQAGDGVIDHIRIDPGSLKTTYTVIGGGKPRGMCGSALIDLTSELFLRGVIDIQGKFRPEGPVPLKETEDGPAFVVAPREESALESDITLSQVDLDILLRSKAAMYTILQTITSEVGIGFSDLHRFYVAGTFGAYIDPKKAVNLGMVPDLPLDKYTALGNSSGKGACMLLKDHRLLDEVESICEKLTYLELNVNQMFMNLFSAARFIPHTDRCLFPSVKTDREEGSAGSA